MRRIYWMPILAFLFITAAPLITHAATSIIPGLSSGDVCACPGSAPDWGCVLQVFQNVVNALVTFSTVILAIFIAWAGFGMIMNPSSEEKRLQARQRVTNAVIGLLIVLASWILVDSIMKVIYNDGSGFGPWNTILNTNSGDHCIYSHGTPTGLPGFSAQNNTGASGSTDSNILHAFSSTPGACSANSIKIAAQQAGLQMSNNEANTFACLARFESTCGGHLQNYNWGKGSSAYGAFQVTLQGNADCFENQACYAAAGVSGPLNCAAGFQHGNPIPGSNVVKVCRKAADNLACSTAAAHCVMKQQTYAAWTKDPKSTNQRQCINQYSGTSV